MADNNLVKVSLKLPVRVLETVARMAEGSRFNRTTIICRAIEEAAYFHDIRRRGGKVLVLEGTEYKEVSFR
jgi:hypothetical protein